MDLISRQDADSSGNMSGTQKALKCTETHSCDYQHTGTHDWIPVTERLPEYDFTDVLICLHDVRHGCEDDYYIIQAYTIRGHWKPTLDINMDDLNVVAWMPLPEPYKEEQDGTRD